MPRTENDTTLEDLQNGFWIRQYKKGFRFGIDAVLLSGYAAVKRNESVLDLGSGTGIIPLLLASKTKSQKIRGIELFPDNVSLARENISLNSLENRVDIICGDIKDIRGLFDEASFEVVVSNPPYMPAQHGFHAPDGEKAAARHELKCTVYDVAYAASYALKSSGRFYMVHRPERLSDIFKAFSDNSLEIKRMRFVHPHMGSVPNMVLIEARKGGAPGIRVEKPLYVYDADGNYTGETLEFYGGQH